MSMLGSTILRRINQSFKPARLFYDAITKDDTIYAPSTDSTRGSAIGVIRLSGNNAKSTLLKLISRPLKPREATLARFFIPDEPKELIDVGLVIWFPKPNSYTGEDVCEIHVHGSKAIIRKMLDTLGSIPGLRPAEPGEFTRRAVQNGKMSLVQAESLPDLIASHTENQRKFALAGLSGITKRKYESWIDNLMVILAHLEASIDFGEDELIGEVKVVNECIDKLKHLSREISNFIDISKQSRDFIKNGFKVVILGRPNAGKSTLMNLLCKRDKSIVSEMSGTTRDIIEHSFEFGSHSLTLSDTAGLNDIYSRTKLIKDHDLIEYEGIKRALNAAEGADLIIYVIDGSKANSNSIDEELEALDSRVLQHVHIVVNKIDIGETSIGDNNHKGNLLKIENSYVTSFISCKTGENISLFLDKLRNQLDTLMKTSDYKYQEVSELDYVNERHLSLLRSCSRNLDMASRLKLETIDEMAQHVRESVDYLSRIVGEVSNEAIFDIVFRDFCIGK